MPLYVQKSFLAIPYWELMLVCSSKIKQKSWDILKTLKTDKIYSSNSFYELQLTSPDVLPILNGIQLILPNLGLLWSQYYCRRSKLVKLQKNPLSTNSVVASKRVPYVGVANLATWIHAVVPS